MALLAANIYETWFASASVRELADGSLEIQNSPGNYVAWILAFVIVVPVSWWCWRRRLGGRWAPSVFIASFVIPLIVVPGMAMESILISPTALTIRTGFWFSPTITEVPLSGLVSFAERSEAVSQRGVPRRDTFWHFRYQSGQQRRIDLPDLLDANRAQALEYLCRHGIRVQDT